MNEDVNRSSELPGNGDGNQEDRIWGLVVFPELIDGETAWALFKGWHAYERRTGSHTVSPALPPPGVLERTVSFRDLSFDAQRQMHLSFPEGPDYVRSLDDLAGHVYWESVVLSEGRIPDDYELFKRLLAEWVWRMRRRGRNPMAEMKGLISEAYEEIAGWDAGDAPGEQLPSV